MMKSDIEVKDIVYNIIKDSELHLAINGSLYKNSRPVNSNNEDILISVMANMNGQFQEVAVEVVIYVQDIKRAEEKVENELRLLELSNLAIQLLDVVNLDGCRLVLEKQSIVKTDSVDEHCINNKIKLTITNF